MEHLRFKMIGSHSLQYPMKLNHITFALLLATHAAICLASDPIEKPSAGANKPSLSATSSALTPSDLEKESRLFSTPPASSYAGVWWRWINGNISKEGITRDLSEMAAKGVRSADIFDVAGGGKVGTIGMMSPEWIEMFQHALREADRVGVELRVMAAAGWGMGGPWIQAADASKRLSSYEVMVDGPGTFEGVIPKPLGHERFYQDVALIAVREPDHSPPRPISITSSQSVGGYCREENWPASHVADRDPETFWKSKEVPSKGKPVRVDLQYHEPITVSSVHVAGAAGGGPEECELQVNESGKAWKTISTFKLGKGESRRIEFPPVTAQSFRLLIHSAHVPDVQLAEVTLLRAGDEPSLRNGTKDWMFKSGNRAVYNYPPTGTQILQEQDGAADTRDCKGSEVIDLSSKMTGDGHLSWKVPPGRWSIMRFGSILVGEAPRVMSAVLKGGFEADAYSVKAADQLYDNTISVLLKGNERYAGHAFKGVLLDSYEIGASVKGQQGTWTDGLREYFLKKRGYDLLPYLPALAQRIVNNRADTTRFLYDYRLTLGELYLDFYQRLTDRAHRDGLVMRAENGYGSYPFQHIDGLAAGGKIDEPMGEVWWKEGVPAENWLNNVCDSVRNAASAAHIYGKSVVAAELITLANGITHTPSAWKAMIDREYCKGLTHAVIHLWSHQYDVTARPGVFTYDAFNANMTWWEESPAFFTYLARCQHLLRQGRSTADLCYFYGEGTSLFVPGREFLNPKLPLGYEFDGMNAEVLVTRMSCKDGLLTLPDGVAYRYMVLPHNPDWCVTLPVLQKIASLVKAGGTVIGPRPGLSPTAGPSSQKDNPEINRLAEELWGNGKDPQGIRKVGEGRVIWGYDDLATLFSQDKLAPDLATDPEPSRRLNWIHRSVGNQGEKNAWDIYFVANPDSKKVATKLIFRGTGRIPEFWDPLTGTHRDAVAFTQADGRTIVPVELEPTGSVFVVFRKPVSPDASGAAQSNQPTFSPIMTLDGAWTASFDPKWGGPEKPFVFEQLSDWTKSPVEEIKYYSGIATYRKDFEMSKDSLIGATSSQGGNAKASAQTTAKKPQQWLDLGEVHEMARVRLNGKDLGVIWCAPWRINITDAIKSGRNELEIEVVNVWLNRLILEKSLPPEKRLMKTNFNAPRIRPKPSGLIGPVQVLSE